MRACLCVCVRILSLVMHCGAVNETGLTGRSEHGNIYVQAICVPMLLPVVIYNFIRQYVCGLKQITFDKE